MKFQSISVKNRYKRYTLVRKNTTRVRIDDQEEMSELLFEDSTVIDMLLWQFIS